MKRILFLLSLMSVVLVLVSCGSPTASPAPESAPSQNTAPAQNPAPQSAPSVSSPETEKDPAPSIPEISDDEVYKLYDLCQPYVESNFYTGTPMEGLDADWSVADEKYGNPSRNYHTLAEFKAYITSEYPLSERFIDSLFARSADMLYESNGNLYVVAANRGTDIYVGSEIERKVIRDGDDRIILRVTHESVDDTSGNYVVTGSFDADNILIFENGRWVWDDIQEYR